MIDIVFELGIPSLTEDGIQMSRAFENVKELNGLSMVD